MQDSLIGLGRGIDGVVGRMVDRVGGSGAGRGNRDEVLLVRYAVLTSAPGREEVLQVDEILVTDGATGKRLEERLLAGFTDRDDRRHLRVHTRILRRWPRRHAPQAPTPPRQDRPPTRGAALAEPTAPTPPPPPKRPAAAPEAPPKAPPAEVPPVAPVAPAAGDPLTERILAALAAGDAEGATMARLVELTGERSARLRARLTKLILAGSVRRAGDGLKTRYRLTES